MAFSSLSVFQLKNLMANAAWDQSVSANLPLDNFLWRFDGMATCFNSALCMWLMHGSLFLSPWAVSSGVACASVNPNVQGTVPCCHSRDCVQQMRGIKMSVTLYWSASKAYFGPQKDLRLDNAMLFETTMVQILILTADSCQGGCGLTACLWTHYLITWNLN